MFTFGCSTVIELKDAVAFARHYRLDLTTPVRRSETLCRVARASAIVHFKPVQLFTSSMLSLWTIPAFWSGANLSSASNTMSTFTVVSSAMEMIWMPGQVRGPGLQGWGAFVPGNVRSWA